MDAVSVWKLVSIFATLLVAAAGLVVSFYVKKLKCFHIGCAIASGVLLATGLTHSLPEGVEGLAQWQHEDLNDYPMAYLLAALAILVLAVIEEGVHLWYAKRRCHSVCEHGPAPDVRPPSLEVSEDESVKPHANIALSEASAVFVFVALSIHSILEGMAIGVSADVSGLYGTLIAILAHKGLAAYALGASMVEACPATSRIYIYGIIFSIATPVGILIGWVGSVGEAGIFSGISNSLAAGTFIYVSTMEFMPITFGLHKDNYLMKVLALFCGFGVMAILPIWAEVHDHAHH